MNAEAMKRVLASVDTYYMCLDGDRNLVYIGPDHPQFQEAEKKFKERFLRMLDAA